MIRVSLRGSVGHLLSRVVVHLPPALWLRTKVQQQPNLKISGFEVVEQLSVVLNQERFHRLENKIREFLMLKGCFHALYVSPVAFLFHKK